MSASCACGRPAPDAFLCKGCALRLERALGDLPALIADLDITLARQAVTGALDESRATKKDAQPLPVHIGAGEVVSNLRYVLVTSVRYLTEARNLQHGPDCIQRKWHAPLVWRTCGGCGQPEDNPTSMARWLLRHSDSIRLDPAGPDIASDIHGITADIWEVVDLPTTRGRFKVGTCPEEYEGASCPGEVWAYLPAEDLGIISTLKCRRCGVEYEPRRWKDVGARILNRGAA